jgi:SET domain-containing protein
MSKRKFAIGEHDLAAKRSSAGLGLFTFSPIKKGCCVVEYTGRVLSQEEMYTNNSKYLFAISDKKMIDGRGKSNRARYINHSCRPNCEIEIWCARAFIMAKRAIKPGEELSYDYGKEYFVAHIRPKGCKCNKCSPHGA